MYDLIKNVIQFNVSSQYMQTSDQYMLSVCCCLVLILTVVTCDWLRRLFKALIDKIR